VKAQKNLSNYGQRPPLRSESVNSKNTNRSDKKQHGMSRISSKKRTKDRSSEKLIER